jgi:hypothetical protein
MQTEPNPAFHMSLTWPNLWKLCTALISPELQAQLDSITLAELALMVQQCGNK